MWENLQDEIRAELGGNPHEGNFARLFDIHDLPRSSGSRAGQIGMRVMHMIRTSPAQMAAMDERRCRRTAAHARYRAAMAEYSDRSVTVAELAKRHDVDVFKLARLAVLRGLSRGRGGKRTVGKKPHHIAALAAYSDSTLTVAEVSARYGISSVTLFRLAKEAGVSRQSMGKRGKSSCTQ